MNSLKRKLFFILVSATGIIWLAATIWIYVGTTQEIESVLDSRLQEAARMVLSLATSNGANSIKNADDSGQVKGFLNYEHQLSCQIWSLDGHLVARSSGAPEESLSENRGGFSERKINGETWRVFTAEDPTKNIRVLVGDAMSLRESVVDDLIKGLLVPMVLMIPVLGLLIWLSLSRGLKPLRVLAEDLRRRSADDMTPVESGRVPSEIQPVVTSLNHLFGRVSDALRHEREVTAFAAHELRTPLAGLRTQAQIAMTAPDDKTRQAALGQIMIAVDRSTRLVRQLLTIARFDSMSGTPMSELNVGNVLQEIIDTLPMSDRKGQLALDPVLWRTVVTSNREVLQAAIRNLHENAVRHLPGDGGVIRWSSYHADNALVVFVEDNGPGIPDEELSHVGDRFFRGRYKSGLGSGLGLSIVELALKASHGRLALRNRKDATGLRAEMIWEALGPNSRQDAGESRTEAGSESIVA